MGMIYRTFTSLNKDIFLPLFKSLIRPHLEYASVIWSPTYRKDIIIIENVQRRATRLVKGLKDFSYEDRLKVLGLPTLHYRRDRTDIIQLYKIMNKMDHVSLNNVQLSNTDRTRGHDKKLVKNQCFSRANLNRYSNRVINPWNDLPQNVVSSKTLNSFKSSLNSAWKNKDNKFCT